MQRIKKRKLAKFISELYDVPLADIRSPRRHAHIVRARRTYAFFLRKLFNLSYPAIAIELGRKDHTTAMHLVKTFSPQDFYMRTGGLSVETLKKYISQG